MVLPWHLGRNQGLFRDCVALDKWGCSSSLEAFFFIMLWSMVTYAVLWNSATPAILTHPSLMCLHSYQYQHVTAYVCTRRKKKCTLNTAAKHAWCVLACFKIKKKLGAPNRQWRHSLNCDVDKAIVITRFSLTVKQ